MGSQKSRHGQLPAPLIVLVALLGTLWGASADGIIGKAAAAGADEKAGAAELINLEVGKALLVRLSVTPDVVMLGNPAVADVVVEDNGLLFLLGREPGETNLLVLSKAGEVILSSSVLVGPLSKRRVTVDRGPQVFTLSCNPRCVPVATPQGSGATTAEAAAGTAAAPGGEAAALEGVAGSGGAPGGVNAAAIASALSGLMGQAPASR